MNVPKRVEQMDEAIGNLRSISVPSIIMGEPRDGSQTIIAGNPRMKEGYCACRAGRQIKLEYSAYR